MRAPGNTVGSKIPGVQVAPSTHCPLGEIPLYAYCVDMGTHAHQVRGTGKITFGVAAKPDDDLSKFHSIRKFPLVPRKLSMLLDF